MGALGPLAEGAALGPIQYGATEVGIGDARVAETALHEHGVAQQGAPQVGPLQATGEHHGILQIHLPQIGALEVAAVEDRAAKVGSMQIHSRQVRFQELPLAEVAAVHVGLDLLLGALAPQLGRGDRPRLPRSCAHHQSDQGHGQEPAQPIPRANRGGILPQTVDHGGDGLWHGSSPTLRAQVMAAMALSLRVVVPPHPLIAHWLTILRDSATPSPLFATAMGELGRWLTYEALRDWLPHCPVTVRTPGGSCEGSIVDPSVPLLAVPVLRGGLGLWDGAKAVVPSARVCHVGIDAPPHGTAHWYLDHLPATIGPRVGVLVWLPQLASGRTLLALLARLAHAGVQGPRLRVITSVASAPGLKAVGEAIDDLTIYCACIDPDLNDAGQILPGFGDPAQRLYEHTPSADESAQAS